MSDPDKLLTTDEVAEALRVKPITVRSYIARGLLPAVSLGGSYRIYQRDLDAFLKNRYNQPEEKK